MHELEQPRHDGIDHGHSAAPNGLGDSGGVPGSAGGRRRNPVVVVVAVGLAVCAALAYVFIGSGLNAARLAGTWECDAPGRPVYGFDAATGKFTLSTLGDPNANDSSLRASTEVTGAFAVSKGKLGLTPSRVLAAVDAQDLPGFLNLAVTGAVRRVSGNKFEIPPGSGHIALDAKLEEAGLTLHVTTRIDAKGRVVNPPLGGWKSFTCTRA